MTTRRRTSPNARAAYQAIAFRADQDRRGNYVQMFVSRGTGADPVAAVIDAYRQAVTAGDSVKHGLQTIFDGPFRPLGVFPAPAAPAFDVMELIG
jgi:hypothetical protein